MQRRRMTLAIGLFFLTAGLALAQKVRVDYNHSTDFFKYKTFSWIKQPVTPQDPFMKQRIIDAVNLQLMSKGLRQVDSNADLAVAVHVATQEKQTLNGFYDGFDGWAWGMGDVPITTVETYTEGTIVADLFDAKTKKIVWRGVATKDISSKPEKVTKEIEKAVEKLFKNFPPNAA